MMNRLMMKRQQGHAAILFALCIPVLFGVFALATDGARALQAKARLEDAAEVASLVVAAKNDDNQDDGSGSGSAVNIKIASDYINHYMGDAQALVSVDIDKLTCDEIPDCLAAVAKDKPRYFEYRVKGQSRYQAWFPGNDPIVGFGEKFDVMGAAVARKYQSKAVDVLFVVDFSGSMNDHWSGGRKTKLKDVFDILEMVTDELDKFNQMKVGFHNRVAITGFNRYTRNKNNDGKNCFREQKIFRNNEVNFNKTIEKQFDLKGCFNSVKEPDDEATFSDLYYSEDFDTFNRKVKKYHAIGGTASYQGILRAGQIVTKLAKNPRQLVIILSDGQDYNSGRIDHGEYTQKLVSRGMCRNILDEIGKMKTAEGETMQGRLAVVGFDYKLSDNQGLKECVGEENIFKAQNRQDILNKILELITEEIGHLA